MPGAAHTLEIGPGTGMLTQFLLQQPTPLTVVEIDPESVVHLRNHYPGLPVIAGDFLKLDASAFEPTPVNVVGNFPYNISSQIFFKILDHRQAVQQVVCMLQKEVAERLVSREGSKVYGILSVLLQAYYVPEMLFKVPPGVFHPPPQVMSAVIRLTRNARTHLPCDEALFRKLVKQGFQNRRKTLRNALKVLQLPPSCYALPVMDLRAEQLSVDDFIALTQAVMYG